MEGSTVPIGYRLAKAVLARPMRWAYDIRVEGAANLPAGAAILAPNHRSFMDSLFLALAVDRPVTFLAKAEYFDRRGIAWMFRSTGQIPLRRGSPAGARQALHAAGDVLSSGGVVGIYPEGTRSRDGLLHKGRLGPARLAVASGVPIVPVGLIGTEQVQTPQQRFPRVGKRIVVRFGAPRWGQQPSGQGLRKLTDEVMGDIAGLCGQVYSGRLAPVPS
jgi:1-acyl-sn-glycerol-3-phosphate acyltransferase